MKNIFVFLSFALLMSACVLNPKPLDVDIPAGEQEPVIASYSLPPQELLVVFSRTFSALLAEGDSLNIEDPNIANLILVDSGLVTLSYAGRTDQLTRLFPGIYASVNAEQIDNERYTLYAKDYKTGREVTAETVLLPAVPLDTTIAMTSVGLFSDTTYTFEARFRDPAGVTNYYLLTYTALNDFQSGQGGLNNNLFNFNGAKFSVFSDQNTGDGNPIKIVPEDYSGLRNDTLVVGLSNITQEYYDYLSAYKRSGGLFTQLVGEPVTLPSNVKGGYGYFAMIRPKLKVVIMGN